MDIAKALKRSESAFRREKPFLPPGFGAKDLADARFEELEAKLEELSDSFTRLEAENMRLQQEASAAEEARLQNALYRLLVQRYSDFVEKNEVKTAQDLKEAVQPNNSHVVELAARLKGEARGDAVFRKAHDYVRDGVLSAPNLGVTFWLSIREVLESKIADYEDKAILLCSLFKALGAEARVLIAELSDGSHCPLVLLSQRSRFVLCDPNSKQPFGKYSGSRDSVLSQYSSSDRKISRILYEFNDKEYAQHEEE